LPDALALLLTEEDAAGAPARRRALDLLLALGADVGVSSTDTPWAPGSRLGASAQDRRLRSVPAAITWRCGGSNAAHANFVDDPTQPISTATTRMPLHGSNAMPAALGKPMTGCPGGMSGHRLARVDLHGQ